MAFYSGKSREILGEKDARPWETTSIFPIRWDFSEGVSYKLNPLSCGEALKPEENRGLLF
ncbi:MAG: hypothetical protein V2G48_07190 [bacterium JZ-2024 1]